MITKKKFALLEDILKGGINDKVRYLSFDIMLMQQIMRAKEERDDAKLRGILSYSKLLEPNYFLPSKKIDYTKNVLKHSKRNLMSQRSPMLNSKINFASMYGKFGG